MDKDVLKFINLEDGVEKALILSSQNHCKASKIHSSGDMRPGRGRGKVRKADERIRRSLPGYFG